MLKKDEVRDYVKRCVEKAVDNGVYKGEIIRWACSGYKDSLRPSPHEKGDSNRLFYREMINEVIEKFGPEEIIKYLTENDFTENNENDKEVRDIIKMCEVMAE